MMLMYSKNISNFYFFRFKAKQGIYWFHYNFIYLCLCVHVVDQNNNCISDHHDRGKLFVEKGI